ncbi:MAG: cytochrome C oxidase subunit IV family protein [Terriglobales bacterium]
MHDTTVHQDHGNAQYYWVWGALLVMTGIEVYLAYEQVFAPLKMLLVLLALSVVKAALIIGYFMHLKFEAGRMKVALMVSLVVCLGLMCVFFADAFRILALGVK